MPELSTYADTILFNRVREGRFFWNWKIIYTLTDPRRNNTLGTLRFSHRSVVFEGASSQESFRLRRNFFGTKWYADDENEQLFARLRVGFRRSFEFADGERYWLRVKRKWGFSKGSEASPNMRATFYKDETPVMEFLDTGRKTFFGSEVFRHMDGIINTDLSDIRKIAGLLIFFQSYLEMRNRHSH